MHKAVAWQGERVREQPAPPLHIGLLGGFRVMRADVEQPLVDWQRRSAKTLTKLLATVPEHALHREQVLEILWPGADLASALNSLGKALHAARRALEPGLPARESSAYLRLTDGMLVLDTEYVAIDADRFQDLAEAALRGGGVEEHETALGAYRGELLPGDRYEDWSEDRRSHLAGLHVALLVGLAEALEVRGARVQAAGRLRAVLEHDPAMEDVHRRLMRLYAEMGARAQAVRQFQRCCDALRRDLGLAPAAATVALYEDVVADRVPRMDSAA